MEPRAPGAAAAAPDCGRPRAADARQYGELAGPSTSTDALGDGAKPEQRARRPTARRRAPAAAHTGPVTGSLPQCCATPSWTGRPGPSASCWASRWVTCPRPRTHCMPSPTCPGAHRPAARAELPHDAGLHGAHPLPARAIDGRDDGRPGRRHALPTGTSCMARRLGPGSATLWVPHDAGRPDPVQQAPPMTKRPRPGTITLWTPGVAGRPDPSPPRSHMHLVLRLGHRHAGADLLRRPAADHPGAQRRPALSGGVCLGRLQQPARPRHSRAPPPSLAAPARPRCTCSPCPRSPKPSETPTGNPGARPAASGRLGVSGGRHGRREPQRMPGRAARRAWPDPGLRACARRQLRLPHAGLRHHRRGQGARRLARGRCGRQQPCPLPGAAPAARSPGLRERSWPSVSRARQGSAGTHIQAAVRRWWTCSAWASSPAPRLHAGKGRRGRRPSCSPGGAPWRPCCACRPAGLAECAACEVGGPPRRGSTRREHCRSGEAPRGECRPPPARAPQRARPPAAGTALPGDAGRRAVRSRAGSDGCA